ncbi:beta-lactamase [Seminavis robusta]|uniref:Beta-lactamase n=1 Tax=Seminavis robusta TaxID=568900 RepID=A0A9N8EW35_9STRA|nr:beta-lactamase [Seminavis robusta]|eukprot:Sro2197_g318690.1 beta-lactamase (494) ;mRNA; r:13279-14832
MKLHLHSLVAVLLGLPLVWGDSFDDKANELLASTKVRGFVVAIKVPEKTDPVIRAYGKISAASNADAVTIDTAFMMASVSKPFAGAALAKMIEQGLIHPDDDIEAVIPVGYGETNYLNTRHRTSQVTFRHVATHRSGLRAGIPDVLGTRGKVNPSYGPTGAYFGTAVGNPSCSMMKDVKGFYRDYMEDGAPDTTVGRADLSVYPGGTFDWYTNADGANAWSANAAGATSTYSNFGIGYIAALVEHKTGISFSQYCNTNLFGPLGMTNTKWHRDELPTTTQQAIPVQSNGDGTYLDVGHYCFIDYASGQLYTTANDAAKWGNEMLSKGTTTLWSSATAAHVFGCQEVDATDSLLPEADCEFSLVWEYLGAAKKDNQIAANSWMAAFQNYDWTDSVQHGGEEAGITSHFIIFPSAGAYGVVMINSAGKNEMDTIAAEAPKTILGALFPEAPNPQTSTPSPAPGPPCFPASLYTSVITQATHLVDSAALAFSGFWA